MPNIKSDITSRNFSSSNFKEFEVTDESGESDISNDSRISLQEINKSLISRGLPPIDEKSYFEAQNKNTNTQRVMSKPQSPQSYFNQPAEEDIQEIDRRSYSERRARTGKERLSDAARKRIEMLCGISRNTKEVEVQGNTYVLRTLKSKELLEALLSSAKLDGTISLPFQTRKELLARSLVKIAGADVSLFLGDDSIEARIEFLDELEEPLLEKLYREYTSLVNEVNASYGLNTSSVSEEVSEDIKK